MAQQETPHGSDGYEKRDGNIRKRALIAVICIVATIAGIFLVRSYIIRATEEPVSQLAPKPGALTLQELRAREDDVLSEYRVVDPAKGIYQIPIDSAMAIIAREAARAPHADDAAPAQ